MNVNVNLTAGQLQKKEYYREHHGRNNVAVGFCQGMLDEAIANQASVDKHVNGIAIELLDFGFGNEAVSAQLAKRFFFLLDQIFADGACTKRKSAGVTLLLFPPPRWRLRQANSLERLQRGHGNQLVENLFSEDLVNALPAVGYRRRNENCFGGRGMPQPLSVIWISLLPPASAWMRMRVDPASSEFSRSSLTTEAGRSTTSPAAILLATCSGRTWMRPMSVLTFSFRFQLLLSSLVCESAVLS